MKKGAGTTNRLLLIAGAAALAGTAISLIAFPALPRQGDSFQYLMAARWVLGEADFTGAYHPAGYPVLLAGLIRIGGTAFGPLLLVVQHVIRLLPLVLFWWLGRTRSDRRIAAAAALIWALAPDGLVFAHLVMAEAVGTGLAAAALVALLAHADRPSVRRAVIAGALVGLLSLFKSVGAAWLLTIALVRPSARRGGRARPILAAAAGFALVVGGTTIGQRLRAGFWIIPASPAVHLFSRVVSDGGALPPGDPGLAALNAMVARPRNAPAMQVWNYDRALDAVGISPAERQRIFLGLAWRGIAHAPLHYALGTLRGCAEMVVWCPPPTEATSYRVFEYRLAVPFTMREAVADLAPGIPDPDALSWMLGQLGAVFDPGAGTMLLAGWVAGWRVAAGWLRWPVILLVLAGCAVMWRASARGRVVVACAILWLAGHAAMEMAVPRYGIPVQPLIFLLACEGAVFAWRAFGKMTSVR